MSAAAGCRLLVCKRHVFNYGFEETRDVYFVVSQSISLHFKKPMHFTRLPSVTLQERRDTFLLQLEEAFYLISISLFFSSLHITLLNLKLVKSLPQQQTANMKGQLDKCTYCKLLWIKASAK